MSLTIRAFRADDLAQVISAFAASAPVDAVSPATFSNTVLLDVNFQADGLMVAEVDGQVVGAIYAVRSLSTATPIPAEGGWITVFFVHPEYQSRGIGTQLLERAVSWLAGQGAAWVNFSGYAPAYFLPGLDRERYPAGFELLTRAGFVTQYSPVAMDGSLATYSTPKDVRDLQETREGEGYEFQAAGFADLPEVIAFASEKLAPDWGQVIRDSTLRDGHPERVVLARDADGQVVGFATYGSYGGIVERFGPFGVDEAQRGTGLGKILLHATLSRMRAEGAHSAWFLWTGEGSPAGHLYLANGFAVTRTFAVMQLDLNNTL